MIARPEPHMQIILTNNEFSSKEVLFVIILIITNVSENNSTIDKDFCNIPTNRAYPMTTVIVYFYYFLYPPPPPPPKKKKKKRKKKEKQKQNKTKQNKQTKQSKKQCQQHSQFVFSQLTRRNISQYM